MTVDIFFVGPVSGYSSYPVVCKGILHALIRAGIRPLIADVTWDGSPNHTDPFFDEVDSRRAVFMEHSDVVALVHRGEKPESFDACHCFAVNPTETLVKVRDHGVKMIGLFVGDVDVVPDSWKHIMDGCDLVMTPSSFGRDVFIASGVKTPVQVLNHGIDEIFRPAAEPLVWSGKSDDVFVFLHLCSAVFCPERKGTPQFLAAMTQLIDAGHNISVRLVFGMKTRPVTQMLKELPERTKHHVQVFFHAGSRPQTDIMRVYHGVHAAVFPSRAEGFGCIPLEVRACGIPVAQTLCTGHRDHLEACEAPADWGIVAIQHGAMVPAWANMGNAPDVQPIDVSNSMVALLSGYDGYRAAAMSHADAVRTRWSWDETTKPLIDVPKPV
jgi:hypothetical protein